MVATDTAQSEPNRKKSKKQKKKQRQQQAQMAATGLEVSSDSEAEAGAVHPHEVNAGATTSGGADDHLQVDQDCEDDVLARMMQAATINQTKASHEVTSCLCRPFQVRVNVCSWHILN